MLWLILFILLAKYMYKIFPTILWLALVLKIANRCLTQSNYYRYKLSSIRLIQLAKNKKAVIYTFATVAFNVLVILSGNSLYLLLIFAGYPIVFSLLNKTLTLKMNLWRKIYVENSISYRCISGDRCLYC